MTEKHEATLTELIGGALSRSREPDPHVVARRLLPKLPAALRDELVLPGLTERVALAVRSSRSDGLDRRRNAGPSRWHIAQRVCPAGDWKLLEDCDVSDLESLAAQHRDIAQRNLARATEFEELAARVRAAGVRTVGELWSAEGLAA